MDISFTVPQATEPVVKPRIRAALGRASAVLQERGNLLLMILTFLFCLLVTFSWLVTAQLLIMLLAWVGALIPHYGVALLVQDLGVLLSGLLFFLTVPPIWLGRLRMAGLLLAGESPLMAEILYYYTTPRRWGRAVLIGLIIALMVLIPVVLGLSAFVGALALYDELSFYLEAFVAVPILIFSLLLCVAFGLLLLFLSGFYLLFAAMAVGNSKLPLGRALGLALQTGYRSLPTLFVFSLRSLWHLVLSLCTVGVLHMLWYAHHYIISYLHLGRMLCKGDDPV
ncbi:MAG: hypothetical protein IJY50_08310 [Clostridia bacterium]|nr:hypothetical protein [Clostridia bacterium]